MGCSSSTQTIARERSRPRAKPEETNGASVVDARSENRSIAEDAETIPDPGHLHADEAPGHGRDQATGGQKEAVAVKNPNQDEEEASDKALDGGRVSSACSDAPAESTEDREGAAESGPNEHSDATAPSHEEAQAPSENE